jgi:hypothetical protein
VVKHNAEKLQEIAGRTATARPNFMRVIRMKTVSQYGLEWHPALPAKLGRDLEQVRCAGLADMPANAALVAH